MWASGDDTLCAILPHIVPAPYFRWKDLIGRCLALLLLVLSSPIMLATAVMIRVSSPGPAIFRQVRVGRHGSTFIMYKFRSMRLDAESKTGPVWTAANDPRITAVGRFIRTVHLDEFPQLINVIKGEMALIGPRPERPEFVRELAREIPGYLDRLTVRPGITGLAQINLPPDSDLDSVRRKLSVDLQYTQQGNAWLDLRIFACTFVRLFGVKGQLASRLFRLQCQPVLHEHPRLVLGAAARETSDAGGEHAPIGRAQGRRPPRDA